MITRNFGLILVTGKLPAHPSHILCLTFLYHITPCYSEFEISYLLPRSSKIGTREDIYISLMSDFDLDAAFQSASLPHLSLKVDALEYEGIVYKQSVLRDGPFDLFWGRGRRKIIISVPWMQFVF